MSSSLLTGVSGLIAHQQMLNVVGNNIANINTTAYKTQQSRFADLMYENFKPAANSGDQNSGGTNPSQIGNGVRVNSITRHFSQGTLDLTGGTYDFAVQGQGFFVVNDGGTQRYTRAGAFGVDQNKNLVDPATGARVVRFGTVGEGTANTPAFQTSGDSSIRIPIGAIVSGEPTNVVNVGGNLSSNDGSPVEARLAAAEPFTVGDLAATRDTQLNDLSTNSSSYVSSDQIEISGKNSDGSNIDSTFDVTGSSTLGDLIDAVNLVLTDSIASLDEDGSLQIVANEPGESLLSVSFKDAATNSGGITFSPNHVLQTIVQGKGPAEVSRDVHVVDTLGEIHTVTLTFQRRSELHRWDVSAALPGNDGEIIDGIIEDVRFDEFGELQQVFGTGLGDNKLTFRFDGLATPQEVTVDFSSTGSFGGLTQTNLEDSLITEQDGFEPGKIVSVAVSPDGVIMGVASNGRAVPIAQLAIATFQNDQGLSGAGSNYFDVSLNSGDPQIGTALSGSKGSVNGGQLEGSNVDVAFEFTRLIVAQRGFSANARTITISDQMLEELTNMIR